MKKTTYVPKGTELKLETLTCGNIVVNGSLQAAGGIRAKRISGNGFISANSVSADFVSADDIRADTIIADTLAAKRIAATEIHAAREVFASSCIRADRVKTGRLVMSQNAIAEIEADEVIVLSPKPRGIARALFVSFLRSKFAAVLFARRPRREKNPAGRGADRRVRKAETPKPATAAAKDIPAGNLAVSDDSKIIAAMHELLKSGECTLRIVPRKTPAETPESNPFTPFESAHGENTNAGEAA
jgi:hypothetical protein